MTGGKRKNRSSVYGWVEDHGDTRIFGRDSSPEVDKRIQAMNKKIEALKEGKQMGRVVLTDEEILKFVEEKKTAQEIIAAKGCTLLTLQLRVGRLVQRLDKSLKVPGLYPDETETIKFGKAGLRIAKTKLESLGYKEEDKFELQHDDKKKQLTLTLIKKAVAKKK